MREYKKNHICDYCDYKCPKKTKRVNRNRGLCKVFKMSVKCKDLKTSYKQKVKKEINQELKGE